MAEGLWDCDSGMAEGLAQRADEDPVGLVQSSDMFFFFGIMCIYVCMYPRHQQTQTASPRRQIKTGEDSGGWRDTGARGRIQQVISGERGGRGVRASLRAL